MENSTEKEFSPRGTRIEETVEKQKDFFKKGTTLSVKYRKDCLKKLYKTIVKYQKDIENALMTDLLKSPFESYMTEIGIVLSEISYLVKKLDKFAGKKRVRTPLSQFLAKSYTMAVPYGTVLIMSPWNYPFLLCMEPLADAIAAGNTAVVKPGGYAAKTSDVIKMIINETFDEEHVSAVTGGRRENAELLDQKFDFVFFTGSQKVGKEVLKRVADNLTPVVLELGGKSPCIVEKDCDIHLAAKRIAFGKFLNCGQTCVAPDYILCEKSVAEEFSAEFKKEIQKMYGNNPLESKEYGKIINEKHFDRLLGLIDFDKVTLGGESDRNTLRIAPTVMEGVDRNDKIMKEEIFGPVMPVLAYDDFDNMVTDLKNRDKALALYIFSKNKKHIKKVTEEVTYGGGCINDVVIHLASSNMPFGGVGESGMGNYHGKYGFDTFSHVKSIVDKSCLFDMPVRYRPYSKIKEKFLKLFLK